MHPEPHSTYAPAGLRVNSSLGTTPSSIPAFNSVVIDVDVALPDMQWLAWLAARRGDIVRRRLAELMEAAQGEATDPADRYAAALALIRPRRADLDALASAYVAQLPAATANAVRRLKRHGARVVLVSTAPRYALLRLGARLELDLADIHGVEVRFDAIGAYVGFDAASPLVQTNGKGTLLAHLDLRAPTLVPESFEQLASLAIA